MECCISSLFGLFLSFCILDSVLMLFPAFVGFPLYWAPSYSIVMRYRASCISSAWAPSYSIVLRYRASCCDGTFSQDLFLLVAWRARSFHRGTMAHIVL
ncbi:hypothetical protein QL285_096385 [Trifolium repens]|nr:hypothetical protein QL285_096385 [Trifolium repens]